MQILAGTPIVASDILHITPLTSFVRAARRKKQISIIVAHKRKQLQLLLWKDLLQFPSMWPYLFRNVSESHWHRQSAPR
jgi:hypothetical protein